MAAEEKFKNRLAGEIAPQLSPHLDLHVMTTEAYGQWVLNLRMHRKIPSKTGYLGYTRQGFMLTKQEAAMLRDTLNEVLSDDTFWEEEEKGVE